MKFTGSPDTHIVMTDTSKNILGLVSIDWYPKHPYQLLYSYDADNIITTEVVSRYLVKVKDLIELNEVVKNITKYIDNTTEGIEKYKKLISEYRDTIEQLNKLKLIRSENTVDYYIQKIKNRQRDRINKLADGTYVEDFDVVGGIVKIPERAEPYFYNSEEDLNQFEIGDKVEVTFGIGSRVHKNYKGKTVTFIVNNYRKYEYTGPVKRLALIPIKDKWSKKDVIILDAYDRFWGLMIDLYPCNRVPYRGWRTKTVSIKKIGSTVEMPKAFPKRKEMSLNDFEYPDKDVWVVTGRWHENFTPPKYFIDGVSKGYSYFCKRIHTTKDRELAIEWLREKIKSNEEGIIFAGKAIEKKKIMLSGAQKIKEWKLLN